MRPLVAFAHYSVDGDISGVTTWATKLLLWLHAQGERIVVLLHHFGPDARFSELSRTLAAAGICVEVQAKPAFTEDAVRGTLDFLQRHQPRVFVPICMEPFFYAAMLAGDHGLPWVFPFHSDDAVYWGALEACAPEAHNGRVIVVSNHIASVALERSLARHVTVIPCGVEVVPGRATFSASPFRVVYSGRVIEEQKRVSLIAETMLRACEDPLIEARFIGDGPALAEIHHAMHSKGMSQRITFTGRLPVNAVADELKRAQCILLMSDYEGLPVALLEAMSVGVVPVVRAIPSGIPEVVIDGETGLLVDETPESAARAISRLAHNRDLWERCSTGAARLVQERFTVDHTHEQWHTLLHKLAATNDLGAVTMPAKLSLPPEHPALAGRDVRRPRWPAAAARKVRGVMSRGLRLLAR